MAGNQYTAFTPQYLKSASADASVNPPIPREGIMAKGEDGAWYNIKVDADGFLKTVPNAVITVGNEQLLTDILKELKKMNIQLSLMTDTLINNTEVE